MRAFRSGLQRALDLGRTCIGLRKTVRSCLPDWAIKERENALIVAGRSSHGDSPLGGGAVSVLPLDVRGGGRRLGSNQHTGKVGRE